MCYRHATLSFDRPCPECGSMQCNLSMYCDECGAELPYVAHPSQCEGSAASYDLEDDMPEDASASSSEKDCSPE